VLHGAAPSRSIVRQHGDNSADTGGDDEHGKHEWEEASSFRHTLSAPTRAMSAVLCHRLATADPKQLLPAASSLVHLGSV
jgi:hypothetical protein